MSISGTPVEDPGTRNALEYSVRSLNGAGQREEFAFLSLQPSELLSFSGFAQRTQSKRCLASQWSDFFSLLWKSKTTSGPLASCLSAAELQGERAAYVS